MRQNRNDLGHIFKMIHIKLKKAIDESLRDYDLTANQVKALEYFYCHNNRASQRDFEKESGLSHSTVSGIIDRLEDKGYVTTIHEGRNRFVLVTDKEQEIRENILNQIGIFNEKMTSDMNEEEVEVLRGLLDRVLNNIKKE